MSFVFPTAVWSPDTLAFLAELQENNMGRTETNWGDTRVLSGRGRGWTTP